MLKQRGSPLSYLTRRVLYNGTSNSKTTPARLGVGKKPKPLHYRHTEIDIDYKMRQHVREFNTKDGSYTDHIYDSQPASKKKKVVADDDDEEEEDEEKNLDQDYYSRGSDTNGKSNTTNTSSRDRDEIETHLFEREIPVNVVDMYAISQLCRTDANVISAINMVLNNLKAGGLAVTMDILGEKIKLMKEHQKVFDIEWTGIFLKDLVWDLLLFGFAVVNLVESNVKRGEMVPMVISHTCYFMTFVDYFGKRREYRVYPIDQGTGMDMYSRYKQDGNTSPRGDPDRNVSVYILDKPLNNGDLASRLNAIHDKILANGWAWENFASTDYQNSHPIFGIQTTTQGFRPEPNETANIAENQLGIYLETQKVSMEKQNRETMQENVAAAYTAQRSIALQTDSLAGGRYGMNPQALVAPYRTTFMAGLNNTIVETPRPEYNPLLADVDRRVAAITASVLSIPPQFLATEQVQHADNAKLNMVILDKGIKAFQADLEPVLQDLFERSYRESHKDYKNAIYNEYKTSKEEEEEASGKISSTLDNMRAGDDDSNKRRTRGSLTMDKFIASSGEPSQSGKKDSQPKKKGDQIKVSKILGRDVTTGPDGERKKRKFGFARPPIELDDEKLKQLVENHISFRISFKRTPLTDQEALSQAYHIDNIIDYDEYAEDSGALIGLDKNRILTEEQHYMQLEKKMKLETEIAQKYAPEETTSVTNSAKTSADGGSTESNTTTSKSAGKPAEGVIGLNSGAGIQNSTAPVSNKPAGGGGGGGASKGASEAPAAALGKRAKPAAGGAKKKAKAK